ncbi:hypothetical protein TELCIR_05810 [Teladorsagia circumcincta]|uniref:Uncharacterized protein n=1 Tax=Teladorsagia circumcincta TaxID=45464 RepID=A0A2G9URE0_TELCI|nr:hypothetical protein TELCIR_05810 [Teladorsagia circumcincta]
MKSDFFTIASSFRWSCPVLETACEENAFITELANKPPPNMDNFFEMADPFANENDMLDISDTIFDVANEFPDIYLRGNLITPSESEFTKKLSITKTAAPTMPTIAPSATQQTTLVVEVPTSTSLHSKTKSATTQATRTKQG